MLVHHEHSNEILAHADALQRITIHDVTPAYFGSTMSEPRETIHPFAELAVTMNFPKTNYAAILTCPLVTRK
ncbi:MAG TPA: hypothetical protein VGF13_17390 [Verrucomicrobiae bacterium]|jgi:hypothetical protein